MSASQATDSRKKQLEKDIEDKRKRLNAYKEYIKPKDDETICVLEAKKSKKEKELKNSYWIQCMTIFEKKFFAIIRLSLNRYYFYIFHYSLCSLFIFIDWAKRCVFQI